MPHIDNISYTEVNTNGYWTGYNPSNNLCDMETMADRIQRLMTEMALDQEELARRAGVSQVSIHKLVTGKTKRSRFLLEVAEALQTTPEYLRDGGLPVIREAPPAYGQAQGDVVHADLAEIDYDPTRHTLVPHYDVRPSAGHGTLVEFERVVQLMMLDRAWVQRMFGVNPARLRLFTVRGDSMHDTLSPGELVLIHLEETLPREGVYVLCLGEDLLVKRLQTMPGGIRVISDNRNYESFMVTGADLERLHIVGRVIWGWRGRQF